MYKIVLLLCIFGSWHGASAQEVSGNDPLNIKFDQMNKGITILINSIDQQKQRIELLEKGLDDPQITNELVEKYTSIQGQLETLKTDLTNDFSDLKETTQLLQGELTDARTQNQSLSVRHENLLERLEILEKMVNVDAELKRIFKEPDGTAKIFNLDAALELQSELPNELKCIELGQILEDFPARALNAFFVKSDGDDIMLCKLEYGMQDWSVSQATVADRGHVIARD
jgi:hypothetical protein